MSTQPCALCEYKARDIRWGLVCLQHSTCPNLAREACFALVGVLQQHAIDSNVHMAKSKQKISLTPHLIHAKKLFSVHGLEEQVPEFHILREYLLDQVPSTAEVVSGQHARYSLRDILI